LILFHGWVTFRDFKEHNQFFGVLTHIIGRVKHLICWVKFNLWKVHVWIVAQKVGPVSPLPADHHRLRSFCTAACPASLHVFLPCGEDRSGWTAEWGHCSSFVLESQAVRRSIVALRTFAAA